MTDRVEKSLKLELPPETGHLSPVVVVRVSTSYWSGACGLYLKRSIKFLRRLCKGHNFLEEDISCLGPDEVACLITNLDQCRDGIYEVQMCNTLTDWETGYVDQWEYKLVPYNGDRSIPKPLQEKSLKEW